MMMMKVTHSRIACRWWILHGVSNTIDVDTTEAMAEIDSVVVIATS